MTRRSFLKAGSTASLGLALPQAGGWPGLRTRKGSGGKCILLMLVGGPSQLDTFDPKPNAPVEIRGPYRPIRTNIRGIHISELFPRTARNADKFAIVRSMHHAAPPVHDSGFQLMQTGRLAEAGIRHPHAGCVAGLFRGQTGELPAHVILPEPIGHTGGAGYYGQGAGFLEPAFEPFAPRSRTSIRREWREAFDLSAERESHREAYGRGPFGQNCLLARRLVERGTRFVTINMFDTVFNAVTWDAHGSAPFCPLDCYRDLVAPIFDAAYSALLADLNARGLLAETLVVAAGEFGRTPRLNRDGGRDHWPSCWSILMAGGGVKGGQVVGTSDRSAAFPQDRPVSPPEIVASIYYSLGVDLCAEITGPAGIRLPVVDRGVQPVRELF